MKKKYWIVLGAIIVIVAIGFRIHGINAAIPSQFAIEKISVNQPAKLDQLELTVKSYSLGEKSHFDGGNPDDQYDIQPLNVVIQVKNSSNTPLTLGPIKELALFEDYDFTQTTKITPTVTELAANQNIELTYTFTTEPAKFKVEDSVLAVTSSGLKAFDKKSYLKAYDEGKYLGIVLSVTK